MPATNVCQIVDGIAINRNIPFDRFTIEQLAGDLIPNAAREQIVATGFNRNHRLNGEGGRIVEEWFAESVIDRVETTGLTRMLRSSASSILDVIEDHTDVGMAMLAAMAGALLDAHD